MYQFFAVMAWELNIIVGSCRFGARVLPLGLMRICLQWSHCLLRIRPVGNILFQFQLSILMCSMTVAYLKMEQDNQVAGLDYQFTLSLMNGLQ